MMTRTTINLFIPAVCAWLLASLPAAGDPGAERSVDVLSEAVEPPAPEAIAAAVRRGVDFLLETQNENGSWGSFQTGRPVDIYAPVPGAHHAFRAATTSLCIAALIELDDTRPEVIAALDRAEAWLLENLPDLRRATPRAIYNSWGHLYGIDALTRMHGRHADDKAKQRQIIERIQQQVDLLERYEFVGGGWGYYDFKIGTQRPAGAATSFTTSAGLIALDQARRIGVDVPQRMVDRAIDSVRRQRKPDFSYTYADSHVYNPMHPVNRPAGSLGRSQVCNAALRLWGDQKVTDQVLREWLDRLFRRNGWLDMGRKRPIPHESWFAVAGYFFYFGHFYAAECIELLPPDERPPYRHRMARLLIALQETDGSWWDFPMFSYHQQYGTAFALRALSGSLQGRSLQ